MAKIKLSKLIESLDEAGTSYNYTYLNSDGTINYTAVPDLTWVGHSIQPPLQKREFDELLTQQLPDALDIIKAIGDQNTTLSYNNRIYKLFVAVMQQVQKGKAMTQNLNPKLNPKLNTKTQQLFDGYQNALQQFVGLFREIYVYIQKANNINQNQNQNMSSGNRKAHVLLQIKDFKNLTTFLQNSPQYAHINDDTFKDFGDGKNTLANEYFNFIMDNNEDEPDAPGNVGEVYNLFKDLRTQCDSTIKSYASLHHNMNAINKYYGISGKDTSKNQRTKEFHRTISLNLTSIRDEDLVKFKYKLLDTDGRPYNGSQMVYEGTFRYYDLRNSYKFINDVDKNNFFEFRNPKPNPIEINSAYNISYNSLRHTNTVMKIYIMDIEIQKVDVKQDFIDCSSVEEIKELLKDIKANSI